MEAVILILALLFFAFVALGVFVTVKAVGAAKRGVERTVSQARRTVEETALRAKSYGQVGVAGELAQLRLSLRTSMRATQEALRAGATEDASLSESLALFGRLSAHGHELDDELKRLEREPDRATVASLLPGLRERTERITQSAESLRWAARDRAQKFADEDLDVLSAQIDLEAGALRHWSAPDSAEEPLAEDGVDAARPAGPGPGPGGSTGTGAASWPDAGRPADGTVAGQTWPEEEAEAPVTGQPREITARDPRQQFAYPWEKAPRPETSN
ncbi:hypothetical protein ABZ208_24960 [Streptomyces sp. NPDC006208]|uniref:hypothetical protein n=1 Tax=Streptomyces sp. NPDC006208 TaxID=3156734 RepID=UPI0033ABBAA6